MNEASTSRISVPGAIRDLRGDSISSIAFTLYIVAFVAAPFVGVFDWWRYVPMAFFAFVAVVAGPRAYRIAGAIALLVAVEAGRYEYRQGQHYEQRFQMPATQSIK